MTCSQAVSIAFSRAHIFTNISSVEGSVNLKRGWAVFAAEWALILCRPILTTTFLC